MTLVTKDNIKGIPSEVIDEAVNDIVADSSMSNLSQALSGFYQKEKNRLVFKGGFSLSELALYMWSDLGCKNIDASVLSRIINGKRLPTPSQLDKLCLALRLSPQQKEYLFYCLSQDYWQRDNTAVPSSFISTDDLMAVLRQLTAKTTPLLYEGKCVELLQHMSVVEAIYERIVSTHLSPAQHRELALVYGTALYAKGRAIGSMATADDATESALPLVQTLHSLGEAHHLERLVALSHILLADAYYVVGGYSSLAQQASYFQGAIKEASRALPLMEDTDTEKLFAIRTIVSSGIYLQNADITRLFGREAARLLPRQPQHNFVNALHLAGTVTKASAFTHDDRPFAVRDLAKEHFSGTLQSNGIYELSDLKTHLETLAILGSTDRTYTHKKIKKGLSLARRGSFRRHHRYFEQLQQIT